MVVTRNAIKEFRRRNGLRQEDLAAYLNVGQSFMSQLENSSKPLPECYAERLLGNDQGWDTSMLLDDSINATVTNVSGNGKVNIGGTMSEGGSELVALRDLVSMLKEQLAEEKARSERYLKMIENMMAK